MEVITFVALLASLLLWYEGNRLDLEAKEFLRLAELAQEEAKEEREEAVRLYQAALEAIEPFRNAGTEPQE